MTAKPRRPRNNIKHHRNVVDNGDVIELSSWLKISYRDDGTLLVYATGVESGVTLQRSVPATESEMALSILRIGFVRAPYEKPVDPLPTTRPDDLDMNELVPDDQV